MKKKTPLEKFFDSIRHLIKEGDDFEDAVNSYAVHRQIERNAIIDAFHEGTKSDTLLSTRIDLPEQYYNETYQTYGKATELK